MKIIVIKTMMLGLIDSKFGYKLFPKLYISSCTSDKTFFNWLNFSDRAINGVSDVCICERSVAFGFNNLKIRGDSQFILKHVHIVTNKKIDFRYFSIIVFACFRRILLSITMRDADIVAIVNQNRISMDIDTYTIENALRIIFSKNNLFIENSLI